MPCCDAIYRDVFMQRGRELLSILFYMTFFCLFASPALSDELDELRLSGLRKELELQLEINKIPGLSIGIVKNGEVVYLGGFGYQNIEEKIPVTKDTIFSISSVSKPITSILAGIKVDDGAIDWDDLITNYLPDYQFINKNKTVPITLRDALSHKSGYGRNDGLWAEPTTTRLEVLKAATKAIPLADYGTEYHYNNVMYLAAGMAIAHEDGFNWDSLLNKRLLKPLQMNNTTTDFAKISADPRTSSGYYWDEVDAQFNALPLRNLYNVAPATGIYSNAEDMSKLLTFILAKGKVQSEQLIQPSTLSELLTPMTDISPVYKYGLGWNLAEYDGELLVEHSGNIEGYSAQIALLPKSGVGFVLLMNVSISPLQSSSIKLVFDALTKDVKSADVKKDYSQFVGDYEANFWQFQNVYFSFQMQGGKPALKIPGQTTYLLNPPDDDGMFYLEVTNKVAVSFNVNEKNEVISMVHHEMGEQFILPKKTLEKPRGKIEKEQAKIRKNKLLAKMNVDQQRDIYEKLGSVTLSGSIIQEQSGLQGNFELIANKEDWTFEQYFKPFALLRTNKNSNGGSNKRLRHEYQLKGKLHEQMAREHIFNYLYWDKIYSDFSELSVSDDKDYLSVTMKGKASFSTNAYIDPSIGHLRKISMQFIDPVWGEYPRTITYDNYQDYCGLSVPTRFVIDDHETGESIFNVTNITSDGCVKF
ncbi:MAG: CubicO group peptidase (beta-lactamase class C family) [Oleiphilaceae bacterium]|jgi:CubicO group peptidase (beta-lactamase class C family)